LECDVDEIVAGLSIYAVTILRSIIDHDALSSQRQLKDVLCSPVNPSQTEPETQILANGELDVF